MSKYSRIRTIGKLRVVFAVIALNVLFFPSYVKFTLEGDNRFTIKLGDVCVGVTDDASKIYDYYGKARRSIANEYGSQALVRYPEISYESEEVIYGGVDREDVIVENIRKELSENIVDYLHHSYTVKVNNMCVTVEDKETVKEILQDAINKYDVYGRFEVAIEKNPSRELNVLGTSVTRRDNTSADDSESAILSNAGFDRDIDEKEEEKENEEKGFDSFEYGITDVGFSETVEIVDAYVSSDDIMTKDIAEDLILNLQEVQQVYKVQSGDTLSGIAMTVGLPLDEIIALNDDLENENSLIRPDQELIITVPKPALSVVWTELAKLEESYNLPTEYIYNDDWYTNKSVTHVQPSAGYHEAVLSLKHINEEVKEKDTLYEEVIMEPVAKVIEVGTMIPPTYIKPIAGGRITSTFGRRKSPTKGASTYHKGIDWGTPIGTSVYASCGGTISSAGWMRGYGYCVMIKHPDGRQTRYGHLSKIKVSVGQYVSQGQVIALSGNTGVSTGPHLHFEILIGGTQVNPLDYLN